LKTVAVLNDKRKFSGQRVLAECEVLLCVIDPFSNMSNLKLGHLVMNMRGGCFYFSEHFHDRNLQNIFPNGDAATLKTLVLSSTDSPDIIINDLKIKFLRLSHQANREGIIFRFVDLNEEQMDLLFKAQKKLPVISASEEASVPFKEVMTLNRHHFHSSDLELESI